MPLIYANTGAATYSQAEYTFTPAQDWTAAGATTLTLYFHGDPDNDPGQMYVEVNGTKVLYQGDAQDVATAAWTQWNIDLAATGVDLGGVTQLVVGIEGSGSGTVYIDDIRLYRIAP
jgi:hypothetical protein